MKATTCISGPETMISAPAQFPPSSITSVEIAIVIGTRAELCAGGRGLDHVCGYTIVNDVSERAFQLTVTRSGTKVRD